MLDRILLAVPVWLLLDLYFFRVLKSVLRDRPRGLRLAVYWTYWLFDLVLIGALLYLKATGSGIFSSYFFSLVGPILLSLIPKLLALPFLLLEDLSRVAFHVAGQRRERAIPARRRFVSQLILGLSAVPFGYVLFGITRGAYNYQVYRHTLYFEDLPPAFDGFTITQLSDIHCGSLEDRSAVERGIALANAQNSELLVLTGDLVNNQCGELHSWREIFSSLYAPFGVYSILGNHDYGDYTDWPSEAEKTANLDRLKALQGEMGFRLLLDEHVKLEKDGAFINLVGVENWGRRFRQYGDLDKAMANVEENTFSVLLSHDPTHWRARVLDHPKPVQLTLSGHTHGMQFGVDIPGLRWSPAKYMYKQWAGIYRDGAKYINVNRGFGFLGFRGRVGIWPEISVITLKRGKQTA